MTLLARILIALCTAYCPLAAQDAADDRTPIDDPTFARVADYYAYDLGLPLHAKVLDTQIYDPHLPYAVDKVHFRSSHNEVVPGLFAYPRDDSACAAVEELYAVLPQPKELIWHQSGHLILMPAQQRIILPWLEKHLSP